MNKPQLQKLKNVIESHFTNQNKYKKIKQFQSNKGNISVEIFLNLPDINILTKDPEEIMKAIKNSKVVQVNEGNKSIKKVKKTNVNNNKKPNKKPNASNPQHEKKLIPITANKITRSYVIGELEKMQNNSNKIIADKIKVQEDKKSNELELLNKTNLIESIKKKYSIIEDIQCSITSLRNLRKEEIRFYKYQLGVVAEISTSSLNKQDSLLFKSMHARELVRVKENLPFLSYRKELIDTIKNNQIIIVIGNTGSGKSTQMAQYILDELSPLKNIVVTQPRKVAATSIANRLKVGYHYNTLVSCGENVNSRIHFMTDSKLLYSKNIEKKYSYIIIDEAHERSIDTDLLIASCKSLVNNGSPLKIIITSATIDPTLFTTYFGGCPIVNIPGRIFPVDIEWNETCDNIVSQAVDKAMYIIEKNLPGDILVFLTGQKEIINAKNNLENLIKRRQYKNQLVLELHGKLQQHEQERVFAETKERKIIFSTNIAETSVTIPGIKHVIDSGFMKENIYDPIQNLSVLKLVPITQSSAIQRKGRAGRVSDGFCYRLFSEDNYSTRSVTQCPEILRCDLSLAILKLLYLGYYDIQAFDFVESPSSSVINKNIDSLLLQNAISRKGKLFNLTAIGKLILELELPVPLAKIIILGVKENIVKESVIIALMLKYNSNIFYTPPDKTSDERKKFNEKILHFADKTGDIIMFLTIFNSYSKQPIKNSNKWCCNNFINAKTLRMVSSSLKDILKTLKNSKSILLKEYKKNCKTTDNKNNNTKFNKKKKEKQSAKKKLDSQNNTTQSQDITNHQNLSTNINIDDNEILIDEIIKDDFTTLIIEELEPNKEKDSEQLKKDKEEQMEKKRIQEEENREKERLKIEARNLLLRKIYAQAFCENIAIYSNSSKTGYTTLGSDVNAKIQIGTSLHIYNETPTWISYYALQKFGKSQLILSCATEIDVKWLEEIPNYLKKFDLQSFKEESIMEEKSYNLSSTMTNNMLNKYYLIEKLESQYKCIISFENNTMLVYSNKKNFKALHIDNHITKFIEDLKQQISETIEFFPVESSNVIQVLGGGGKTNNFMKENQVMQLKIIGVNESISKSILEKYFTNINCVNFFTFQQSTNADTQNFAIITFNDPIDPICSINIENNSFSIFPIKPKSKQVNRNIRGAVKFSYFEGISKGNAKIVLNNSYIPSTGGCLDGKSITISKSKKGFVYANNLSLSTDEESLKDFLESRSFDVKYCAIFREDFSITPYYKKSTAKLVKKQFKFDDTVKIKIDDQNYGKIFISCSNITDLRKTKQANNEYTFNSNSISPKISYFFNQTISKPIYEKFKISFENIPGIQIKKYKFDINLSANLDSLKKVCKTMRKLDKICETQVIKMNSLSKNLHSILKASKSIVYEYDKHKKFLYITGTKYDVNQTVDTLKNKLTNKSNEEQQFKIVLSDAIIDELQLNKTDFIRLLGIELGIDFEFISDTYTLQFTSNKEKYNIISRAIKLRHFPATNNFTKCNKCGMLKSDTFILNNCYHPFCASCLSIQVEDIIKSKSLFTCMDCNTIMALPDILEIVNPVVLNEILDFSRETAISNISDTFLICPNYGCTEIFEQDSFLKYCRKCSERIK